MAAFLCKKTMVDVCNEVIEDVIISMRDFFIDEGVDEQILQELKQTWESKLLATKIADNPKQAEQSNKENTAKPQPLNVTPNIQTGIKMVPIKITLPSPPGNPPKLLMVQVPAVALENNQLKNVLTEQILTATVNLPPNLASGFLQQHINSVFFQQVAQSDGPLSDSSDDDETSPKKQKIESDSDDDDDDEQSDDNLELDEHLDDENPLNSEDDITDDESPDLFDCENVIVCQYDKISRTRNKWKLLLKDGIMNLNGEDYVFQKASGEAEW